MYQQLTIVGLRRGSDGVEVDVRIGFPRGLPFSMVEGFEIDLDGHRAGRDEVLFGWRGQWFTPAEMVDVLDRRWEFGEIVALRVPGFVPGPGRHRVTVAQYLRVGPGPEPARTVGTRTLESA